MASSAKIAFILLLAFSVQINAREFFSKFSSVNNDAKATTTVANTEQQQETSLPNKQDEQYVTKEEQEPTFLPQTQNQNGYGLYGHESGQFPSETTAATRPTTTNKVTYAPYVTPIKSDTFENYNPNTNSDNTYENQAQTQQNVAGARFSQNNNNNNNGYRTSSTNENSYYNGNGYERQGMSDTRTNQNFGNARFADNTNANNGYRTTVAKTDNRYYNGNGNRNNPERQGMSDTRFMENGKYYYDVENENNYYQNQKASRVPLRNEYTYNNKGAGYYGTNIANSENQMSGQRYENNQDDFEEEFEP